MRQFATLTVCERPSLARLAIIAAAIGVLVQVVQAHAADIVGRIADSSGAPVVGTQVLVQDLDGKTIGSALTDPKGHYEIRGLDPGPYNLIVRGQSGVAYVGKEGLTVNWGISKDVPPLAIARKGVAEATVSTEGKRPVSPMSVESK
jgi:hypothetical protein